MPWIRILNYIPSCQNPNDAMLRRTRKVTPALNLISCESKPLLAQMLKMLPQLPQLSHMLLQLSTGGLHRCGILCISCTVLCRLFDICILNCHLKFRRLISFKLYKEKTFQFSSLIFQNLKFLKPKDFIKEISLGQFYSCLFTRSMHGTPSALRMLCGVPHSLRISVFWGNKPSKPHTLVSPGQKYKHLGLRLHIYVNLVTMSLDFLNFDPCKI